MSHTRFRVNSHSIVCLNVKELLSRSRCHIWNLSDSNVIRSHNYLVRKRTLNHLAKLAKWLNVDYASDSGFTLKLVRDIIVTFSLIHRTNEYSQHSSTICLVWLNGCVRFRTKWLCVRITFCHLNFRYGVCFEQEFPWHSGKL